MFAIGYALQAQVLNRTRSAPDILPPLLAITFGLSIVIQNGAP